MRRTYNNETWWIREAVRIRQESKGVVNTDEGIYQLSYIYNKLLLLLWTSSREQSFRRTLQLLSKHECE